MNTTQLIAHWTMHGAGHDIDGRFRKTDDIRTVLAAHHDAPQDAVPRPCRCEERTRRTGRHFGLGDRGRRARQVSAPATFS